MVFVYDIHTLGKAQQSKLTIPFRSHGRRGDALGTANLSHGQCETAVQTAKEMAQSPLILQRTDSRPTIDTMAAGTGYIMRMTVSLWHI